MNCRIATSFRKEFLLLDQRFILIPLLFGVQLLVWLTAKDSFGISYEVLKILYSQRIKSQVK